MGEEVESEICEHCSNYHEEDGCARCKEKLTIDEMFNYWNIQKACSHFNDPAITYIESRVW